jgi:hypothetical protein
MESRYAQTVVYSVEAQSRGDDVIELRDLGLRS